MADYILVMKNITKEFPGVKALDNVNLEVERGEIHALVGENGAGKSTLMNVLSGTYPYGSYTGDIIYNGEVCQFNTLKDSEKRGIVIIHQELALIPELSIGENMFLGNERKGTFGIDWDRTYHEARTHMDQVGLKDSEHTLIKDIGTGKQQLVEIAKALSKNVKLLILDEPTSSLNEEDSRMLLNLLLDFKKQGMTSIIISHKLNEIAYVADRITVVRDGATIETIDNHDRTVDEDRIIRGMVGRELSDRFPKRVPNISDEKALEVKNWTVHHPVYTEKVVDDNVSFYVRKGEIVGFGGLVGAQRTEFMEAIFGMRGIQSGEIYVHGNKVDTKTPRKAMNAGIGLITEDRRGNGILGCLSIKDNTGISIYDKHLKAGFVLDHPVIDKIVDESIQKLRIKTPNAQEHIANLSGGNQQKVIIARWLANDPDVLIMDEPTRGIDVGAKHEIYEIMVELQKQGKAIIMISSEMAELLGMSDRIYVMCNGHIRGEITDPAEMTQEKVMSYATMF